MITSDKRNGEVRIESLNIKNIVVVKLVCDSDYKPKLSIFL